MSHFCFQRIIGQEAERNYFESQLIILDTLVKTLNSVSIRPSVNSFPASGDFCHLLITYANSLDPDQAQQSIGPDLDPNCLTV